MQNYNYPRNFYAFVNGVDGAKNYPIMPNQSLMLMDTNHPVCYMKVADGSGKPSLKCFKLVETSEDELILEQNPDKKEFKDEISSLNAKIDDLITLMKGKKSENG